MKFLHLIPYFVRATKTGGPAQNLIRLATSVQAMGHDLTVVTTNGNLDQEIELEFQGDLLETEEQGVQTIYLRRKNCLFPATYYYAPGLLSWLRGHIAHYDLVVLHGMWTYFGWACRKISQERNKPYLIFVHGSLDPWAMRHQRIKKAPYWHLIEKRNFEKARGFVLLNQDEAEQLRLLGIQKPVVFAQNGLNFPLPSVDDSADLIRKQWPEMGNKPFVYFMSRLHYKKGLDPLLHAWKLICADFSEWRLIIAGPDEGGYQAKLLGLTSELDLQNSVFFIGLVTGNVKTALLQEAAIFVLPSFSEGVPGAVVEALAYGCPVLITPGCHLPEVADAKAGLIVEPDPPAIAEALRRLMQDPVLREKMAIQANNLAVQQFDRARIAREYVTACAELFWTG